MSAETLRRLVAPHFIRTVEEAAIACARTIGRGDRRHADAVAVAAMRRVLDTVPVRGRVVIGEGERDRAPMLWSGEEFGARGEDAPQVDIAVDPLEGTNLCAVGGPGAITVLAAAERGGLLTAPDIYMDKIMVGPAARGLLGTEIRLDHTPERNLGAIAEAEGCPAAEITVVILDRAPPCRTDRRGAAGRLPRTAHRGWRPLRRGAERDRGIGGAGGHGIRRRPGGGDRRRRPPLSRGRDARAAARTNGRRTGAPSGNRGARSRPRAHRLRSGSRQATPVLRRGRDRRGPRGGSPFRRRSRRDQHDPVCERPTRSVPDPPTAPPLMPPAAGFPAVEPMPALRRTHQRVERVPRRTLPVRRVPRAGRGALSPPAANLPPAIPLAGRLRLDR